LSVFWQSELMNRMYDCKSRWCGSTLKLQCTCTMVWNVVPYVRNTWQCNNVSMVNWCLCLLFIELYLCLANLTEKESSDLNCGHPN
jgi:hypothetical protein